MSISAKIESLLREEYKNGATQDSLSKKYKISQAHICELFSGKQKFNNLEVSTLEKMFPKAVIYLFGEKNTQKNKMGDIVDSNANIGNNNNIEANNFLPKDEKKADDTLILEYLNNHKNRRKKLKLLLEIEEEMLKQKQKIED